MPTLSHNTMDCILVSLYTEKKNPTVMFKQHVIPRRYCHNYCIWQQISINAAIRNKKPHKTRRKVLREQIKYFLCKN